MKNFEVFFKNNQFVDKLTGKALHFKPNATYAIQGDNENFLLEDFLVKKIIPLNTEQKKEALHKKFKSFQLKKIADEGTFFYFRIGLRKITEEEIEREYLFRAVIQEDLYLKSKIGEKWNLCNCICKAIELVEGDLGFPFEENEANSLSELFANVVSTYFNKRRATACNAFTTFYFEPKEETPSLYWIKNRAKFNLDLKRKSILINEQINR